MKKAELFDTLKKITKALKEVNSFLNDKFDSLNYREWEIYKSEHVWAEWFDDFDSEEEIVTLNEALYNFIDLYINDDYTINWQLLNA